MSLYIDISSTSTTGVTSWDTGILQGSIQVSPDDNGIHPILAFKYIKRKFNILEKASIDRRLKKLEKAFYQALENGQEALGNKIAIEVARESRESILYAKGYKNFVERDDIWKVKNKIKGGHISDTMLGDFTKVIPKDVIKAKKKAEPFFDDFVIYHYYNSKLEEKIAKKQKMSAGEKEKMKDPILFGVIAESDRLYYIADWEDEHCDLTFDELINVVANNRLTKYPELKFDK